MTAGDQSSPRELAGVFAAAAAPAILSLALIFGAHYGLVDAGDMRFSLVPTDALAFGVFFALAAATGSGIGARLAPLLKFTVVCACLRGVRWLFLLLSFGLASLAGTPMMGKSIAEGVQAVLIALAANAVLGMEIGRAGLLRLAVFVLASDALSSRLLSGPAAPDSPQELFRVSVLYLPLGLGLMYEHRLGRARRAAADCAADEGVSQPAPVQPPGRRRILLPLLIAFLPPLLLSAGIVSYDMMNYDGYCYGFTDGKWQCSIFERVSHDVGFLAAFLGIPCAAWIGLVLLLAFGRRRK